LQTKSVLDVRTVVVVASIVALVALAVWSIGLWLTSTQPLQNQINDLTAQKNSLQTQVTSLQNQVASLNAQLAENQQEIEDLEAMVATYQMDITNLLEPSPTPKGGSAHTLIQ